MPLTELTLEQKLAKIQVELKTKKTRYNSFGKYYFRSAEDILEAIKPFLIKYDVTVRIEEKYILDSYPIIKSTAIISNALKSIKATAIVGVDMEQKGMQMPQKFGTASSYGKKYALGNLFLIDDTQDADATNTHGKKLPSLLANTPQYKKVTEALKAKKANISQVKQKYTLTKQMEEELLTI